MSLDQQVALKAMPSQDFVRVAIDPLAACNVADSAGINDDAESMVPGNRSSGKHRLCSLANHPYWKCLLGTLAF
jgi:hypothetical protein